MATVTMMLPDSFKQLINHHYVIKTLIFHRQQFVPNSSEIKSHSLG